LLGEPDVAVKGDCVERLLDEHGVVQIGGDVVDGLGGHDATAGRKTVGCNE